MILQNQTTLVGRISDIPILSFPGFRRYFDGLRSVSQTNEKGCLLWPGELNERFYGIIKINKKPYHVHRVAFRLYKGIIPAHFVVMHDCDVPSCYNPEHLFLGTQQENVAEMIRKGRAWWQKERVETTPEVCGSAHRIHVPYGQPHEYEVMNCILPKNHEGMCMFDL